MTVFGLTGNIGSGKSTVGKILTGMGFLHIDADKIGHQIVDPGKPANIKLQQAFGSDYFDDEGNLLRKKLGAYVFSQPEALVLLNNITHPAINEEILRQITVGQMQNPNSHIVLEAAVLFEAGMEKLVEKVILVVTTDEVRLQRVMERDGLPRQLVVDRMNSQMNQLKKQELSDYVIENNSDLTTLKQNIGEFLQKIHFSLVK